MAHKTLINGRTGAIIACPAKFCTPCIMPGDAAMSLAAKYQRSLNEKRVIRFKTRHPDGDAIVGVVMSIKKSFIVLYLVNDFEFCSIAVVPKKMIRGYRDGEIEDCYNDVIQRLELNKDLSVPAWLLECETLCDVLLAMQQRDIWPAVEIVYDVGAKTHSAFFIGQIRDLTETTFTMNIYGATAEWGETYELDIAEIFKVETGDSYSRYFNEYMRKYKMPIQSNGKRAKE